MVALVVVAWALFWALPSLEGRTGAQTAPATASTKARQAGWPAVVAFPPPAQVAGAFTVAAVGDIMLGSSWPDPRDLPPNDGAELLREVTPLVAGADVAFGNLEGPLTDRGNTSKCPGASATCHAFRVPTRYGKHLQEAGFDVLSLANNHALDFGPAGRASSERVLDGLGIAHSGRVGDVAHLVVKGKKIDLIAFATYPTSYNLNDLGTARKVVGRSAATADIVIVSFHGGAEGAAYQHVPAGAQTFLGEKRGDLRKFARAVIEAGADLVLGHGPHVVRGMEVYRKRLIAYSLGNFATYGKFNLSGPNGLSLILEVRLAGDGEFLGGRIHPVKQEKPGGPRPDPQGAIIPMVRTLSQEDFAASAIRVAEDGTLSAPPAP